jgi:RES domain
MDKYQAFEKLKEHSKNLTSVSYEEIFDLLKNGIRLIPLPIAKIWKYANIDRVRPNNGTELFKHIDELGYIKDKNVIDNFLTSFGRANNPHQVMFYGALETTLIDKPRLTAIAETSHIFRIPGTDCTEGKHYTVSRWETQKELFVVEVVFSEYALKNNPDIAKSFQNQTKLLQEHNLEPKEIAFHLDFLKFISEEFSKKVTNPEEYKISAAYTNLAILHPDVSGITYPSVQTDYFGINIVLMPEVVKKYIKPKICSTQILYKKGMKSLIVNGKNYCKDIDINKDIQWKEHESEILTTKEQVIEHLK